MGGIGFCSNSRSCRFIYINTLTRIVDPIQIGLYHDDGILYTPNSNGPKCSSIQEKIIRAFKFLGIKIEISFNIKIANYVDVTLNLSDNSYRPFLKTKQYPSYINVNSNHPSSIIKQVTKAVNMRIRRLSSNKKICHESSKMYIEALKNCGVIEALMKVLKCIFKPSRIVVLKKSLLI